MEKGFSEYTAIYFNIHNFRYVNKVLPHLQADEVMKLYANMVANSVTSQELVGRLGGDNFVALVRKKDIIMFENIARLAKELGIQIIAEGVETKQQYEYLADVGCDMIQGYYFDKPLPEEEFLERVNVGHY